jgi:hypothetical protein
MLTLPIVSFVLYAFWVELRPVKIDNMTIHGRSDFKQQVLTALTLLKTRSPQAYQVVTNNIRTFVESKHTGIAAYENPPTSYLHDKSAWVSNEAFAAGIAHESLHSKLYHDRTAWTGENVEKLCCEYQQQVLKEIGGTSEEIAALAWNPKNRYWEIPFEQRDW